MVPLEQQGRLRVPGWKNICNNELNDFFFLDKSVFIKFLGGFCENG